MKRFRTSGPARGKSRAPLARMLAAAVAATAATLGTGCTAHLFSGVPMPDRSRPVVRIETTRGVEYGAATELGILFLGRTATDGACRVHYYVGPDRNVADGVVTHAGGIYYRAEVDYDQQSVPILARELEPDDQLFAIVFDNDGDTERVEVQRVLGRDDVQGDLLIPPPGVDLPVGTGLFLPASELEADDRMQFVGLVAASATLEKSDGGRDEEFLVFTGVGRMRGLLATPERLPAPTRIRWRADGTWYRERMPESEVDPALRGSTPPRDG